MNLLILVTAMFSIIAFFMFSVSEIVKTNDSQMILARATNQASSLVNSSLYCDSIYYYFPTSMKVLGRDYFYKVKISPARTTEETADGETISYVIFTIYPRNKELQDQAIASNSFRTNARVYFFNMSPEGNIELTADPDEETVIDPQLVVAPASDEPILGIDTVVMIKQIIGGKNYLFIVPCNHSTCDLALEQAAAVVIPSSTTPAPSLMCDSDIEICCDSADCQPGSQLKVCVAT